MKPLDGVIMSEPKAAWISLQSSRSWWRMELRSIECISGIYLTATEVEMQCVEIKLSKSTLNTVITINCVNLSVGKYLYVVAADRAKAALYLAEINVYGCEGYRVCF